MSDNQISRPPGAWEREHSHCGIEWEKKEPEKLITVRQMLRGVIDEHAEDGMPAHMTTCDMMAYWLETHEGYDALVYELRHIDGAECACELGDLAPCIEGIPWGCVAGHKGKDPDDLGHDWFYSGPRPQEEEKEE